MNDDRLGQAIGEFYRETDATPPDSRESARQVAARLQRTPQVRRRRWLPSWRRGRTSPADTSRPTEYEPRPIPPTDGQTPTVIGRTQTMFSPSKALIAGALVFGIGGAMLIAQPFQQQGRAPGATADVAPTWVTGTIDTVSSCSDPDTESDGDVTRRWNYVCSPQIWTASDPRLAGEVASVWNDDEYRVDAPGGVRVVNMSALFVRNDGGGWTCSSPNLLGGGGLFPAGLTGGGATYACVGDEGYAGLSAILLLDGAKGYSREFSGLIFPGGFPPLPEPPAAQ